LTTDTLAPATGVLRIAERTDLRVLVPALLLTGAGLAAIGSTRPDLLGTQLSGVVVGVAAALALVLLPYRTVIALAWPLWLLSVTLLLAVLIPGVGQEVNGARRWLRLGGMQIQPSELAKAAHVLLLARYVRFRQDYKTFRGLFVPFALTLVPALLVLREPDLGTALLLVPSLFAVLWAAGARTRHLLLVVGFAAASLPLVYVNLEAYQQRRVDTFLATFRSDQARAPADAAEAQSRRNMAYQGDRAELAIAAGGLTGQGWGEGRMNLGNKVPEDWTDFIFTVHAEEWGFAGSAALVLLYGLFFFALASVAQECREPAARLLCVGALVTLACQTCVNLLMTMKLAPVTGVPLPFLSYGRSAMLSAWLLTGLALHAKAREPHVFTTADFE
jgi:rod shape determining protein RodA